MILCLVTWLDLTGYGRVKTCEYNESFFYKSLFTEKIGSSTKTQHINTNKYKYKYKYKYRADWNPEEKET